MITAPDARHVAATPRPRSRRRAVVAAAVLFVVQFVVALAPWATPAVPAVAVAIAWFATGTAIAGVWLLGAPAVAVVVAATCVQRLVYGYTTWFAVGESLGSGLEAWVGALLLRRFDLRPDFARLRDVLALFAAAAVVPFVSMFVAYVTRAVPGGFVAEFGFLAGWTAWWRMNALGAVAIVPIVLAWRERVQRPVAWRPACEGLATVLVAAGLMALVVFVCEPSATCITMTYAVLVIALVGALRHGPLGAGSVALVGVVFVTVATAQGHGPFLSVPFGERHAAAQVFALTLVAVPLVLGALIAERTTHAARWSHSEEARRALLAVLPDATLRVDVDGRVRDVHLPTGQELLLPRVPAPGAPLTDVGDAVLATRLAGAFAAARVGERPDPIDFVLRRDAGERVAEVRCVPAGGGEVLVVVRDVTMRRDLEAQLRHAQKLEAVGLLAGGVAHDFNNLLTVVGGNAEDLLRGLPADDPRRELAGEIAEAARRGADLTRQLLAFSRQQTLAPEPLDLGEVVTRLVPLLRRLLGSDVAIAAAVAAPAWVRADRSQLEQVVMNLAVNARDAMPRGGALTMRVRTVSPPAGVAPGLQGAPCAELEVCDDGVGMTADVQARAFEPFFTTKPPGRGTGLGLATVYGIVQQSGGAIALDSGSGRGTTVRVWLPLVAAPAADAVLPPPVPAASVRSARILLVEDERPVRTLLARALAQAGHTVVVAHDGEEALAVAAATAPFDLLVTDVVMPRLGGVELVQRLRAVQPGLPVLFVTAHALGVAATALPSDGRTDTLGKPFAAVTLVARVDALLAATAAVAVPK